jgi:hypothetical protein
MKMSAAIACAVLLALPGLASAGEAHGCDAVNFGKEVLEKMPNAQRLCRGVTMKNDAVYVHYVADVVATTATTVTVDFKDKDNKAVSRVEFEPAADQMVKFGGKDTKYTSLKKGTTLDFWIEHNKWGLYASPDGKAMTIIRQETLVK